MEYNYDPILVTGSRTLSFENRMYIVDLAGNATLTFPAITCDGIRIQISRQGNTANILTLETTNPNLFYIDSTTTTNSYILNPRKYADFVSYNGNWIMNSSTTPIFSIGGSYISGTCVSNNTNIWVVCTGGGNNNVGITTITVLSGYLPTLMTVTIYNISATVALTGRIVLGSGLPSISNVMSIPIANIPPQASVYTTTSVLIAPIAGNQYTIQWLPDPGTSSSHKFGICSVRLA